MWNYQLKKSAQNIKNCKELVFFDNVNKDNIIVSYGDILYFKLFYRGWKTKKAWTIFLENYVIVGNIRIFALKVNRKRK